MGGHKHLATAKISGWGRLDIILGTVLGSVAQGKYDFECSGSTQGVFVNQSLAGSTYEVLGRCFCPYRYLVLENIGKPLEDWFLDWYRSIRLVRILLR
jgi:hypothetical protein